MKVMCRTLFDCTHTGVTGHFRPQQLPYTTKSGIKLETPEHWNLARNQQRNWESILQIVSLRTQPMNIVYPVKQKDSWHNQLGYLSKWCLHHSYLGCRCSNSQCHRRLEHWYPNCQRQRNSQFH